MSLTIENVGEMKRLLEPFDDEMRIEPPLEFRYVAPFDKKKAYLNHHHQLTGDTCHQTQRREP